MKKLSFLSIHPEFLKKYFDFGVFSAAAQKSGIEFEWINLRDFAVDRHGSVDDRAFGGGDGMIMRPDPLAAAVKSICTENSKVFYTGPAGKIWNQSEATRMSQTIEHGIFICGRFGGVDQRFIDRYVDYQVSLGDFVISGGELAALIIADSMLRLIPGVLGNKDSAANDSFGTALPNQLEHPQYTRPAEFEGMKVPDELLSGNHSKIESWKTKASLDLTSKMRPDLVPLIKFKKD